MKKSSELKYPHSASLFQFCRLVLDRKFGGIRVIDQDVGQILGFDPADCSHWKKGKKNIRSIQAMKSIAEHLGVDERLVVDIAAGELNESEAFYEYTGYGAFDIDAKVLESAKKDFYRRHAGTWTREREQEFKAQFDVNETRINEIVQGIHTKINFTEAPLYLPEVVAQYNDIKLAAADPTSFAEGQPLTTEVEGSQTTIKYPTGTEVRPYMRYGIAKALGKHFLKAAGISPGADLAEQAQHISDVQCNLFAAKLLTPAALIRSEMTQINVAKDIVSQMAEVFWVSKTFMNRRLKDILQSQPPI